MYHKRKRLKEKSKEFLLSTILALVLWFLVPYRVCKNIFVDNPPRLVHSCDLPSFGLYIVNDYLRYDWPEEIISIIGVFILFSAFFMVSFIIIRLMKVLYHEIRKFNNEKLIKLLKWFKKGINGGFISILVYSSIFLLSLLIYEIPSPYDLAYITIAEFFIPTSLVFITGYLISKILSSNLKVWIKGGIIADILGIVSLYVWRIFPLDSFFENLGFIIFYLNSYFALVPLTQFYLSYFINGLVIMFIIGSIITHILNQIITKDEIYRIYNKIPCFIKSTLLITLILSLIIIIFYRHVGFIEDIIWYPFVHVPRDLIGSYLWSFDLVAKDISDSSYGLFAVWIIVLYNVIWGLIISTFISFVKIRK